MSPQQYRSILRDFCFKAALEVGSGGGPKLVLEIWGNQQGDVRVCFQRYFEEHGYVCIVGTLRQCSRNISGVDMLDFR